MRHQAGLGIASTVAIALWLVPQTVCMQQSRAVLWQLIAGEQGQMLVGDVRDSVQQHVRILLIALPNDERQH